MIKLMSWRGGGVIKWHDEEQYENKKSFTTGPDAGFAAF